MKLHQLLKKLINYNLKPITFNQNQEAIKMKPSAIFKLPLTLNLSARGGSDYVRKPLTLISKRRKTMKAKIFFASLLFAVIFFYSLSYSQVPQMINYQGMVTDAATGEPLNGNYDMTFSIYAVPTEGTALWTETHDDPFPLVSVEDGMFNVLLGSVTPIPFDVFNGDIRYLGVQVDEDEEMTPRREIVSVAYAFRSVFAERADDAFYFDENADAGYFNSAGVIGFNYTDTTWCDRRLRITAGKDDNACNTQGASIDLHGNRFAPYQKNGDLDLVAGAGISGYRGDITFWTGSTLTERMRISSWGGLSIGTTVASWPLSVAGPVYLVPYTQGKLLIGRYSSTFPNAYITARSGHADSSAGLIFQTHADEGGQLSRMIITGNEGNVGIGTTSPGSYKLYVNGTAYSTGGWQSSDLRLKKNVENLTGVVEKLKNINGVKFDWRCDEFPDKGLPEAREIGIIAQEVEKEFPELVSYDNDGYKVLAYDRFVAVLLEAIKEQQKEIEQLKAQLNIGQ